MRLSSSLQLAVSSYERSLLLPTYKPVIIVETKENDLFKVKGDKNENIL